MLEVDKNMQKEGPTYIKVWLNAVYKAQNQAMNITKSNLCTDTQMSLKL